MKNGLYVRCSQHGYTAIGHHSDTIKCPKCEKQMGEDIATISNSRDFDEKVSSVFLMIMTGLILVVLITIGVLVVLHLWG
jgi:hypothetical protein